MASWISDASLAFALTDLERVEGDRSMRVIDECCGMRAIDECCVLWVSRKTDKGTDRQTPRYTLKYT
jgi:hypothetical protein